MKYLVKATFKSGGYDSVQRSWTVGQVVELNDDLAAWAMRCGAQLEPYVEPEPRAPEAPQHDRMTRRGRKREA